ncbi:H-NS family nucleoid-associated regulatory protein [Roseateles violae]|uniref:H-NS family nucleoid-associated regulatory protein n=1 Tax=Roseateles violae TaxID=3058042 RepID=A0ABT8E070_9BURK|nr:H-NS family nucleoid-associated regulatory protein [Pelomonas sp. PFR6]MDN3923217.1 H-NS family nucleoid-associated regulatory protein [Pelomonas sp. PFR6]
MAKSLSRIMIQIEKLQKEAAQIQSVVIARIRKEIAQFGLTAEHLFGTIGGDIVGGGRRTRAKATKPKTAPGAKSPKFADNQGNTWGGMGKRPQWIRDALAAGRSLDEFLLVKKKATAEEKSTSKPSRKTAAAKKAVPKKVGAKKAGAKKTSAAKVAARPGAAVTGKAPATKRALAAKVVKAVGKAPSKKKIPAKKRVKTAAEPASAASIKAESPQV